MTTLMHVLGGQVYYEWCVRKKDAYNKIKYSVDGKKTENYK